MSHSPEKQQNWLLLFYQSGKSCKHIENMLQILSRGSLAQCFNVVDLCLTFLKTWPDTFKIVLVYGKEQESRKKHNRAKKFIFLRRFDL